MKRNCMFFIPFVIFILGFSQLVFSAQIKLAWDANTESDLAGYRVYYGTSSKSYGNPIDAGNENIFALTGLTQGQTYYIVITAYDTSDNESVFSEEVSGIASELTPSDEVIPPTVTPPLEAFCADATGNTGVSIYLASYDPNRNSTQPIGNIKKYEISSSPPQGEVLDSTKSPALDSVNQIKETTQSFWSSQADGGKVDKGGVGEVLITSSDPRNIFTYLGDSMLTADSNKFSVQNNKITPELLGLAPEDTIGRETVIQYVLGFEPITDKTGKVKFVKREWVLGAVVNSRPLVIPYCDNSKSVVFVGANDGMLHAFDDSTGKELWGFIPTELLGRLKELTEGTQLAYYVDGSPKAYITDSQKILLFGLRKGGTNYYALDVTDPTSPKLLWKIGPETVGYSELAQTWSAPEVRKMKYGDGEKAVCIFGAGYDKNKSKKKSTAGDLKGRAVYVTDVLTGIQVWRWDYQKDPNMKYSIPSDVSCVDADGDKYIDRLYVGDMGGNLWRFNIGDADPTLWSANIIFSAHSGVAGSKRKIFYKPDVTLEKGYDLVFFGTGDREYYNETKVANRIYALKDKGNATTLTESDLENVTQGIIQPKSSKDKEGWVLNLENKGEKVLAPPVVAFGVAYFTTYTPPSMESGVEGMARIYALNYKTGGPILDLNPTNNTEGVKIDLSDRSKIIGKGIPSGTVVSAIKGRPVALTGIGKGIYKTPLRGHSTIIPIWWREVKKDK